jgi:hypothetical protein
MASEQGKRPTAQDVRAEGASVVITMSRCTACGSIGSSGAKVHVCYCVRNEWGEHERDHYEPTELVDFALLPDSARPHDG